MDGRYHKHQNEQTDPKGDANGVHDNIAPAFRPAGQRKPDSAKNQPHAREA